MSERTLATNSEEVEETTPDETQEVDAISSETLVTEDSEIKKRNKRNIFTAPEQNGMNFRLDANGESRLVID